MQREIHSVTVRVPNPSFRTSRDTPEEVALTWAVGRKIHHPRKEENPDTKLKIVEITERDGYVEIHVVSEATGMRQVLEKYPREVVRVIKYETVV